MIIVDDKEGVVSEHHQQVANSLCRGELDEEVVGFSNDLPNPPYLVFGKVRFTPLKMFEIQPIVDPLQQESPRIESRLAPIGRDSAPQHVPVAFRRADEDGIHVSGARDSEQDHRDAPRLRASPWRGLAHNQ